MANWELQLISSILHSDNPSETYREAVDGGIEDKLFGVAEARTLWNGITFHYKRTNDFGKIPSITLLKERYGEFDLPAPQEDFSELCKLVSEKHRDRMMDRAYDKYLKERGVNPTEAFVGLQTTIAALNSKMTGRKDIVYSDVIIEETKKELQQLQETGGVTGVPYPWEPLNQATGGIQPGDYIMIFGIPKSMKTWLGLVIAAHLVRLGYRVLVYSKEMQWESLRKRINCLLAMLDYTRYKKGELTHAEEEHLFKVLEGIVESPGEIFFTDATKANGEPGGPIEIREKMQVFKPDFVLLDSAYMLEYGGKAGGVNALDWKSLQLVNRMLKEIAKTTGTPMAAILQENERAALQFKGKSRGTASLSMNTQAVQDCDLAIRVVYNIKKNEQSLHIAAARETQIPGFTINAVACTNFSYAHDKLWEISDVHDDSEEDNPTEKTKKYEDSIQDMAKEISLMGAFKS